jgi:hypothetical protein
MSKPHICFKPRISSTKPSMCVHVDADAVIYNIHIHIRKIRIPLLDIHICAIFLTIHFCAVIVVIIRFSQIGNEPILNAF